MSIGIRNHSLVCVTVGVIFIFIFLLGIECLKRYLSFVTVATPLDEHRSVDILLGVVNLIVLVIMLRESQLRRLVEVLTSHTLVLPGELRGLLMS